MFSITFSRRSIGASLLGAVLALGSLLSSPSAMAESPMGPKVHEAMAAMKAESAKLGAPKLDGENLYFGSTKINGNFDLVDGLKGKFGGTATFFIKKGDGFQRVSTNVQKEGKRAVGTMLDPNGPAIAAIKQGKPFYGLVDILGKLYDTGYEPIRNAKGDIIGIYYVGYSME